MLRIIQTNYDFITIPNEISYRINVKESSEEDFLILNENFLQIINNNYQFVTCVYIDVLQRLLNKKKIIEDLTYVIKNIRHNFPKIKIALNVKDPTIKQELLELVDYYGINLDRIDPVINKKLYKINIIDNTFIDYQQIIND